MQGKSQCRELQVNLTIVTDNGITTQRWRQTLRVETTSVHCYWTETTLQKQAQAACCNQMVIIRVEYTGWCLLYHPDASRDSALSIYIITWPPSTTGYMGSINRWGPLFTHKHHTVGHLINMTSDLMYKSGSTVRELGHQAKEGMVRNENMDLLMFNKTRWNSMWWCIFTLVSFTLVVHERCIHVMVHCNQEHEVILVKGQTTNPARPTVVGHEDRGKLMNGCSSIR